MQCPRSFLCVVSLLFFSSQVVGQPRVAIDQKLAKLASLPESKERVTTLVGLAYDYLSFHADSARLFAHASLQLARKVGDGWGEATYYIWEATVQQHQNLPDQALANLDTALAISARRRDTILLAGIYQTKANILLVKHEGYAALAYMEKAEQLARHTRKGQLKTRIQMDKGRIHQAIGEIENAMACMLTAVHLADSMGREDLLAHAYTGIGSLFTFTEDEPKLREYAEKALVSATKSGNPFLKAQATYKLGVADALRKDYEAARQKLEESLNMHRTIDRPVDAAGVMMALIKVLVHLKQYDRADALWTEAGLHLDQYPDQEHGYKLAKATLLEETGQWEEAEKWYKKNVEMAEETQDRSAINTSYREISEFYERKKDYPAALAALRSAKQILSESTYAVSMRRAIEKEIEVGNERDKAYRERQIAVLESDKLRSDLLVEQQQKTLLQTRLHTEQQQRQLSALEAQQLLQSCEIESKDISLREAQLTREKREREMALLNQEKSLQSAQLRAERLYRILLAGLFVAGLFALYFFYRRLQRSRLLELRANIAQDLHDDLGSEMSGISLASFSAARSGDPARMGEALQTIAGQSSRLVEDMRDIVWSIHPDNDSLEKIAARMRQYAAQMLEPQDVAVHFQVAANALPLKMQPEARKHLYLFFKEAIHNIARHARCDRADVGIRREKGSFVLEIHDNGQGFDPDEPMKTTGGNGLRNLRHRAEVLGGKLVVESRPGAGAVVRLVAPLA